MPNKAPIKVSEFYVPNQPVGAQNYLQSFTAIFSPTATIGKAVPRSFAATLFPASGSSFPSSGLTVYYKLDSSYADSVGSNTLTPSGSPGFGTGIIGNALALISASSQYAHCADNAAFQMGTGNFTMALWVKFTSTNLMNFAAYGTAFPLSSYRIGATGGKPFIAMNGVSVTDNLNPLINDGNWHLLILDADRTGTAEISLYRDNSFGTQAGVSGSPGSVNSSAGFTVGGVNSVADTDATIDEIGIWNRRLTTGEMTAIWNGGAGTTYGAAGPTATLIKRIPRSFAATLNPSGSGGPVVDDFYSETNQDNFSALDNNISGAGQSFVSNGGTLVKSTFYLKSNGSPTGNVYSKLYALDTVLPNGVPTGTALAVSDPLNSSTLTGSYALRDFTFSGVNQIALVAGTAYGIVMEYTSGTSTDYVIFGADSSTPTHPGKYVNLITALGVWTTHNSDLPFYVYVAGSGSGPAATLTRKVAKALSAGLSFVGAFAKTYIAGGGHLYTQSLAATLSFVGTFAKGWHSFQSFTATLFHGTGGGGGTPDLVNENFEGTGYATGWSGPADPDYTGLVLSGTQSLDCVGTNYGVYNFGIGLDEIWDKFLVQAVTVPTSSPPFYWFSPSFANVAEVSIFSNNTLTIDFVSYETFNIGTTYYFWRHYKKNVIFEIWWNTVDDKTTATYASTTAGSDQVQLPIFAAGASCEYVYDNIQMATTDVFSGGGGGGWADLVELFIAGGHAFTQALTATLSSTAALTRRTAHGFTAATLSFVGAMTRRTSHSLAATLSFAGSVAKRTTRSLTATLSFVGAMTTLAVHHFTQAFTATLSFIGTFSEKNIITRAFTATLSFVGASSRSTLKALSATLGFVGNLPKSVTRFFAATLVFSAALTKNVPKSVTATLSFVGSMTTLAVHHFVQAFTATLAFIGTFAEKNIITRAFTATLNATAAFSKSTGKVLSATLSWSASLVRRITRSLSATLSFTGTLVKAIRDAGFSATLSFAGNLVGQAAHFFARAFTATLSFAGSLATHRTVVRVLSATLAFSATLRGRTAKVFAATLTVSGQFKKVLRKVFAATLTFIGFLFRGGAVTVLAGWITKCFATIGIGGSVASATKTGSQLTIEKVDESGIQIQVTTSTLTVERTQ